MKKEPKEIAVKKRRSQTLRGSMKSKERETSIRLSTTRGKERE